MTIDSIVTIIGTLVTLLGMGITIWQALQVRKYRDQIKSDVRKINLTGVSERLKRAQEDIRRLPTSSQSIPRGVRPTELIRATREHFDLALGTLDANGPDRGTRSLLAVAQNSLNLYEISWNSGTINPACAHELQEKIQDAVSQLGSTIYKLEGKA